MTGKIDKGQRSCFRFSVYWSIRFTGMMEIARGLGGMFYSFCFAIFFHLK